MVKQIYSFWDKLFNLQNRNAIFWGKIFTETFVRVKSVPNSMSEKAMNAVPFSEVQLKIISLIDFDTIENYFLD